MLHGIGRQFFFKKLNLIVNLGSSLFGNDPIWIGKGFIAESTVSYMASHWLNLRPLVEY